MAGGAEFGSVTFGLASAATWGIGDFSGGLATRRAPVLTVVLLSQLTGLSAILVLALLRAEANPMLSDVAWGAVAGVVGQVGLFALYRAMAIGQMGIAAPITAVLAAGIPALFGALTQGLPDAIHLIGFGVALAGVYLISRPQGADGRPAGLRLAFVAGLGFAAFLILIAQVHQNAVFWPLAAARLSSISVMLGITLARRRFVRPSREALLPIVVSGVMDVAGNTFYVLAEQAGRLDIAAVLSSLYPASTVLLALIILKERLTRPQLMGVLLALAAIPLIAVRAG